MSLQPGAHLGPYTITAAIGAGGMGEVYRAHDTSLHRDVALKILPEAFAQDAERVARFRREAQVLASLNHPNIAHIHGLEESGDVQALVMELVEGPTLAKVAGGPVPLDDALAIAEQIAAALEAAHERGIIHRDLKPANVKVRDDGTVKVLDFGLAKALEPAVTEADTANAPTVTSPAMTELGVILGTAAYMAPEQARGKPVDRRADIWAFGCVLFELLSGGRVFGGDDISLTLAEVIKSEPEWSALPPNVPWAIDRLLRRCLDKDARRRLRDIGEARVVLADVRAGAAEIPPALQRADVGRPWAWMGVSAALAVALAAILLFGSTDPPGEPVRRFSKPLPRDALTFSFALSPDGSYAATESVTRFTTQIFLQALDSWNMNPVPDTEGAGSPFWSPDSREIAFFAGGKLKSVPVAGGPAAELAEVPGLLFARGAWGRDDVIIVAGSSKYDPGPLYTVSATGGDLTPLTTTEPGEAHLYPHFLPDGRHFLYTSSGGSEPGIYVASLDEPTGTHLLADVSSAAVAPDQDGGASLLFVRNGDLTAVPFNLSTFTVRNEPVVLVEQLDAPMDDGAAGFSVADDGTLMYLGGSFRHSASRFAWFDREGTPIRDEGPPGSAAPVGLAPDGATLIVPRNEPGRWKSDLWRHDLSRRASPPVKLTYESRVDSASNVVWSPHGRILFTMAPDFDVFSMDPFSTAAPEPFLSTGNPKYPTDWSTDGRYVVYTELGADTGADVWYVEIEDDLSGGVRAGAATPFATTAFRESSGRLSPDGAWISYTSNREGGSAVYVRPFPVGDGEWKVSDGYARHAVWSRTGEELFYLTGQGARLTLMRVPIVRRQVASAGGPADFDFGEPERLFDLPINGFNPATGTFFYAPSADGQQFLVNFIDVTEEPALRVVTNWRTAFGLEPRR